MKPGLLILSITLLFCSSGRVVARIIDLEYTLQRRDSNSLTITVAFTGNRTGATLLHLPNEWAGQQMLYKAISLLQATSKDTKVDETAKPFEYWIHHRAGARVVLTYNLRKDWDGPLRYPLYFRPVIERNFFYFEGYSGLAYPDMVDSVKIKCTISHQGFATGDFIGNSFYSFATRGTVRTTLKDLLNSFFCGGQYRTRQSETNKNKIVLATVGKFSFTDDETFSLISRIILAERDFWSDPSHPYFLTVLLPLKGRGNSGGTAHFNSFSLFQDTNLKLSQGLTDLISHEYFHSWIGQGLRMPSPEEAYKWFSEGFTDYYSAKILLSIGILTKKEFENKINKMISEYYQSPYFELDNKMLIGRYWENMALKQLSYRRGSTIAFAMDSRISEKPSISLDDLMKALYEQSKPALMFSDQLFDQLAMKYSDSTMVSAIHKAKLGINGELTQCLVNSMTYKIKLQSVNPFELGFDLDKSQKAKRITGLIKGSNAELAGLTEGMELTNKFSIYHNNTQKPAKVQVLRNGVAEWIEYIPVSAVTLNIPAIVVDE